MGGGKKEMTAGGRPFTMRFLHRNEEMAWERAQRSTLTNWMNYILKKYVISIYMVVCVCECGICISEIDLWLKGRISGNFRHQERFEGRSGTPSLVGDRIRLTHASHFPSSSSITKKSKSL